MLTFAKLPVNQYVCISCATRLQIASARVSLQQQHRLFRATCPARRPPSAATAQKESQDDQIVSPAWVGEAPARQSHGRWLNNASHGEPRGYRSRDQGKPQHYTQDQNNFASPGANRTISRRGGWARNSVNSDLTPEEQALRESLKERSVKPAPAHEVPPQQFGASETTLAQERRPQERFPTIEPVGKPGTWICTECEYHNFRRNVICHRCKASLSNQLESEPVHWMCTSCKKLNAGTRRSCWSCRAEKITGQEENELSRVQGWRHVRRLGTPPLQQPVHNVQPEQPPPAGIAGWDFRSERAREHERERLTRLEGTKDGRYVGLGGQDLEPGIAVSRTRSELDTPPRNRTNEALSADVESIENNTKRSWYRANPQRQSADSGHESQVERLTPLRDEPQRTAREMERPADSFFAPSSWESRTRARQRSQRPTRSFDDLDGDEYERMAKKMERKEQRKKAKAAQKAVAPATPIYLPEFISISNLAGVLRVRVEDFIRKMGDLGFEATNHDHILDAETAGLVVAEFNFEPIIERTEDRDLHPLPPPEDKSLLTPRPPVVTIMGHVDHGKTTLLDYLRKSSVAASEHGGITQHIGAFSVKMPGGRTITFLDTPGHEAFLSMRQRGANVTDIVILVVAADDSVKPQTVEAIKHAQAAKVPMIVAINKIDKEESNVDRVKQDLARYSVELEDYGGDTQVVCVSGKTGQGMEELEDAAVALADILDMRAEVDGQVEGWVLEATTTKAGRVATVLVRRGTLRPGDVIVAGTSWARVRSLKNEAGAIVPFASPGTPVEIDGWRGSPNAGDEVIQAPDEQKAKSVMEYRLEASDRGKMATDMAAVNEARRLEQERREQLEKAAEIAAANTDAPNETEIPEASTTPTFQEVFFIIKGDVSGSVEAVTDSVSSLGNSEVRPHILRSGIGPVSEFDIDHAAVAKGHIINFNTTVSNRIRQLAESKGVDIIDHSIIYRLVDDVKAKLSEKLPPNITQKVIGEAEIGQIFEINLKGRKKLLVAGCKIRNGVIGKNAKVRVLRDDVIYDGMSISSSLLRSTMLTELVCRYIFLSQKCQERRHRNAQGHGMRHEL